MEAIDLEDLDALCRVCLHLPEEAEVLDLQLICDKVEDRSYLDCLSTLTEIVLSSTDGLPHNLCKSCGLELQIAYDFHKKVTESKRFLKHLQKFQEDDINVLQLNGVNNFQSSVEMVMMTLDVPGECEETEEMLSVEELDDEEAMPLKYKVEPEADNYIIDAFDEVDEGATSEKIEMETMSWQQAVVAVANEEHLPLLSSDNHDDSADYNVTTLENGDQPPPSPGVTETATRKRFLGKFNCEFCNKMFPNHSRMMLHRRSHDVDRPRYPCTQCNRVYATKQAMDVHIRAVHAKTGYSCPVCNKVYAIKKGLEVHLRYHTGTFPYVCSLCDKRFAQICHLNTHTNVRHNSVRFSCEYPDCGKFFTSSASLRNHEFSHGDMPFECDFCQRGYPAKSKLKVHMRRKHGQDMTLDQLERMRKFFVKRTKLNLVRIADCED